MEQTCPVCNGDMSALFAGGPPKVGYIICWHCISLLRFTKRHGLQNVKLEDIVNPRQQAYYRLMQIKLAAMKAQAKGRPPIGYVSASERLKGPQDV